jgi:heat shock protein HslJ
METFTGLTKTVDEDHPPGTANPWRRTESLMKGLGLLLVILAISLTACAPTLPGQAGPQLVGTSWVVTRIGDAATLSDHQPTMRFEDATVLGSTGCNHYSGAFTAADGALVITQVAITEMACLDQQVTTRETAFKATLGKIAKVAATADGLELRDAAGQALLSLAPPGPEPSPRPLAGTTWELTTIRTGQVASSLVNGSSVSLQLKGKSYRGTACDSFGGDLSAEGAHIKFGTPHSTGMTCKSADLSAQESTVLGMLSQLTTWTITGNQLSISAPDGSGLDFRAK